MQSVIERTRGDAVEARSTNRRRAVLVWALVGLVTLGAGAVLYHPPYLVVSPGSTLEVGDGMTITGVPLDEVNGRYLMTTVHLTRPNALQLAWGALRREREVLPASALVPPGVTSAEYGRMQRQVFIESRLLAAAAATRAVGLPVKVTGSGARVLGLREGSPVEGKLSQGDVILSVDDREVTTAIELLGAVRSRPAGSDLVILVERKGGRERVVVESAGLPTPIGGAGIGVFIETRGLDVELPFEIRFEESDIGGPSAGLAYALAIADRLDERDLAQGRTVVATGTIDLEGDVGSMGSVGQRAIAVSEGDADLFLVPRREVGRAHRQGLAVRGVEGLEEALALLVGA